MIRVTTKIATATVLAAALALPGMALAEVQYRAKSGAMTCPANNSPSNYYYFTNSNTRNKLKILKIQITDGAGKVVKTWTAGKNMPKGLPKSGILPKRSSWEVQASEIAKGITSTKSPFRARLTWKNTVNRVATQPAVALVRNFYAGSDRVSQRASTCKAIHPSD